MCLGMVDSVFNYSQGEITMLGLWQIIIILVVLVGIIVPVVLALKRNTVELNAGLIKQPFRWGYYISYTVLAASIACGIGGIGLMFSEVTYGIIMLISCACLWFLGRGLSHRKKVAWGIYLALSTASVLFLTLSNMPKAIGEGIVLGLTIWYISKRWDELGAKVTSSEEVV